MEISEANNDLKLTITETAKGAMAMGGSTTAGATVGGLVGGPPGMILGGFVGFLFGANYAANNAQNFKPLLQVLSGMSEEDKKRLEATAEMVIKREGYNFANDIVQCCGSTIARRFLITVYEEFSGKKLQWWLLYIM